MSTTEYDAFEKRWDAMPEGMLELIDGRLIISTLAGSRRIAWNLLVDYGPPIGLEFAPADLWWSALAEAHHLRSRPRTPQDWWQWAQTLRHDPEPPPAGPNRTGEHHGTYQLLKMGFYYFSQVSALGASFGRDFVVRLGDDALTPDQIFIDRERLARLHHMYFDGPPTIAVEVVQPGSESQDRQLKWKMYEQARVPEFWLLDPFAQEALFLRWQENAGFVRVEPETNGIYRSSAVPDLALSLPELWTMNDRHGKEPWRPFLPCTPGEEKAWRPGRRDKDELGWDSVPFVPRVGLQPCRIRFEEFISWCGQAKFECYGGGLKIDGSEVTRRVFGMLLMTLGLTEVVKLAHARDWILFLEPSLEKELVDRHVRNLLRKATYGTGQGIRSNTYYRGEVEDDDAMCVYADTEEECKRELEIAVGNWVRLRLARGESLPPLEM